MYSIEEVMKVMRLKGYKIFENDTKDANLNYVGIRTISDLGEINDVFVLFWKYKGRWNQLWHPGTTDPGKYYEQNLMSRKGVAILKEGQYRGAWTCGKHRGRYDALVQLKPVTVIRDANKDGILDLDTGVEETGFFGINHHRMHKLFEVKKVGKYGGGCQVRQLIHNHLLLMSICKQAEKIWGKGISYTLLNTNDF